MISRSEKQSCPSALVKQVYAGDGLCGPARPCALSSSSALSELPAQLRRGSRVAHRSPATHRPGARSPRSLPRAPGIPAGIHWHCSKRLLPDVDQRRIVPAQAGSGHAHRNPGSARTRCAVARGVVQRINAASALAQAPQLHSPRKAPAHPRRSRPAARAVSVRMRPARRLPAAPSRAGPGDACGQSCNTGKPCTRMLPPTRNIAAVPAIARKCISFGARSEQDPPCAALHASPGYPRRYRAANAGRRHPS